MNVKIIKENQTIPETVQEIKKLSFLGSQNPEIKRLASQFSRETDPVKAVFDWSYKNVLYRPDESECTKCSWKGYVTEVGPGETCPNCNSPEIIVKQQLRTVENILRTKRGNCTSYSILQAALLLNLKKPVCFRVVSFNKPNVYEHIYIISGTKILDPCLAQKQDGSDTWTERPIAGYYNREKRYNYKIDYCMNRLEILQGTNSRTPILGRSQAIRKNLLGCAGCGGGCDCRTSHLGGKFFSFVKDVFKGGAYPVVSSVVSITGGKNPIEFETKAGRLIAAPTVITQTASEALGKTFVNGFTGGMATKLGNQIREGVGLKPDTGNYSLDVLKDPKKLAEAEKKRMEQEMAALNAGDPTLNLGPENTETKTSGGIGTMLLIAGLGIGAVMMTKKKKGVRRK